MAIQIIAKTEATKLKGKKMKNNNILKDKV